MLSENKIQYEDLEINLFTPETRRRFEQKMSMAQYYLDEQIKQDTNEYVPMRSGLLSNTVNIRQSGSGQIVYATPYAQFLYYGKVMVDTETGSAYSPLGGKKKTIDKELDYDKSKHGLAGPHWYDRAYKTHKERWIEAAREGFRRG